MMSASAHFPRTFKTELLFDISRSFGMVYRRGVLKFINNIELVHNKYLVNIWLEIIFVYVMLFF